jgi:hypothetical protein
MSQGWRLPRVMYDSWTDGMLLDPAILSVATIINDQIHIENFKSSLPATRPGIRGEGETRPSQRRPVRTADAVPDGLKVTHTALSFCFGLSSGPLWCTLSVLHVLHRGQSALCNDCAAGRVTFSGVEWRRSEDLGPSSPTGCEAGFHGSAFHLASAKSGGIKAPYLFFNATQRELQS